MAGGWKFPGGRGTLGKGLPGVDGKRHEALKKRLQKARDNLTELGAQNPADRKAHYFAIQAAGRYWYWKLDAEGAKNIPALPAGCRAIRVSDEDVRLPAARGKGAERPEIAAVRRLGGQASMVKAQSAKVVYATRKGEEWVSPEHDVRALPGPYLVDLARASRKGRDGNQVVGFQLGGKPSVLVLWSVDEKGNTSSPLVILDPEDVDEHAESLADREGLGEYEVVLIKDDDGDLYRRLSKRAPAPYPISTEWRGIKKIYLYGAAVAASALVCAGLFSYSVVLSMQKDEVQAQIDHQRKQMIPLYKQGIRKVITRHALAYAQEESIPVRRVLSIAGQVWRPGLPVTISASTQGVELVVRVPKEELDWQGGRRIDRRVLVNRFLEIAPPDGFSVAATAMDAAGKEYVVTMRGRL